MDIETKPFANLIVLGASLVIMAFTSLFSDSFRQWGHPIRARSSTLIVGLVVVIILTLATSGMSHLMLDPPLRVTFFVAFLAACIYFSLAQGMLFYSLRGRRRVKKIKAYVEFLTSTSNVLLGQSAYRDPSRFYADLPYAYAFGLTDDWADHLRMLEETGEMSAMSAGGQGQVYNAALFGVIERMRAVLDELVGWSTLAISPPSSSGEGDGGSCNGGP